MSVEIVHITRGDKVESIHRGDIVAVDINNNIVFNYGDSYKRTFWRSSAKPFQAIPMIEAGGIEKFNLNSTELALICSSHGGEEKHVKLAQSILSKIGKTVDDLDCGVANPMHVKTYVDMLKKGQIFTKANNPCSGKHSGMLTLGVLRNYNLENYILIDHEIQQEMLKSISNITEMKINEIDIAIDGCGVPVFGLPIYNMALAYAKLGDENRKESLRRISIAMIENPYYVAGTGRLDTIIMEETKGKVLAKLGAESVYCMSIIDKGIGIAMKTEDGAYRALDAVIPSLLLKHGYIDNTEYENIMKRVKVDIKNHREEIVGKIISAI
ncbi:asparaginase [Clostridiaceae bacterium HSG29]|nr:asparaginase [Clostridiaceae bacterium HSG29]